MKSTSETLSSLGSQFALLSLLAFGGANSVVPEMHRQSVDVQQWLSDKEFAALFAIAQAAPGPNFMISTLVGWKAAGIAGALVATLAMATPSCILAFWVSRMWERYRSAQWRIAIAAGLAPVTVGLVASSGWLLSRGADTSIRLVAVTVATVLITGVTKINPLWCLAAAAALGYAGIL